ncbi:MAG: 1-deoxy-D-xylulose-5-phosphate synthase [Muribaculaceae bacterium]|nr:1-deoxy-D-xylulose-5-phosphate synthase [Muribaculaceae bacterium]
MSLLTTINSPADLRQLSVDQLPQLCSEIREFLIENLSKNPGHFASSMGAVDLIVALHYVYNTPEDHLVWDVGHQAYAHKILTGRREAFATQRTLNGISGFPNPLESEADTFMAGHAGNSISAALGMAIADHSTPGHENRKTVAVIGDASISGGLAFEGLNNASNHPNNLLIVLNDNDMSIDNNVGALHHYLSNLTTSAGYNRWRNKMAGYLRKKGILTEPRKRAIIRFGNSVKSLVSKKQNIFEGLNIRYFGPIDGNDVVRLVKVFREIKDMEGPRLLHVYTTKGRGYAPAEADPTTWHAPGKFDPKTGERLKKDNEPQPPLWQDIFGETLVELARMDEAVVGVTAAMPTGTSMCHLMKAMPERSFDVGISEGHAVTFAGGLAAGGKKPFVAIYSSFLQRAYDNIVHDVAIQGLPVTFCIDRAGIVGEDGVTHHGLFDLAYLHCIPGLQIASPADSETLRNLMYNSLNNSVPLAIRYPRGKSDMLEWKTPLKKIPVGKGRQTHKGKDAKIAVLTIGPALKDAERAAAMMREEGVEIDVYDMIWMKPLDKEIIAKLVKEEKDIITVEDGVVTGGFGSAVADAIREMNGKNRIKILGVPDKWISQGTVGELKNLCGYDLEGILRAVKDFKHKEAEK